MDLSQQKKQIRGYVSLPKCTICCCPRLKVSMWNMWFKAFGLWRPQTRAPVTWSTWTKQCVVSLSVNLTTIWRWIPISNCIYIYIIYIYICIPTPLEANKETTPGTIWYNYYVVGKLLISSSEAICRLDAWGWGAAAHGRNQIQADRGGSFAVLVHVPSGYD